MYNYCLHLFPVCVGCTDGYECCGKVWGNCVCYNPRWNSCCYQETDPICVTANSACYALKASLEQPLHQAQTLVDHSRHALDVVIAVLEAAKLQATVAKGLFDVVVTELEIIKLASRVGIEAENVIVSVGLGGAINIEKLEFDALLSTASTGAFTGSLTACFVGQASTISINVDLHDTTAMARQLADHVVSGLSSHF